jgi:AcrR family transcriptional regulator
VSARARPAPVAGVSPVGGAPRPATDLNAGQRARRDRIVQAAIRLLETGEYDAIQMRDVAAAADVALATVYRYFSSKEHLYAAALLEWSRSFAEGADLSRLEGSDEERLRRLLRRIVRAFEQWPQMFRAEVALVGSQDARARSCYAEWAERNLSVLQGALPTLSPADAAAVVDVTGVVLASRLREWALGRCSIDDVHRGVQRAVDLIFTFPGP